MTYIKILFCACAFMLFGFTINTTYKEWKFIGDKNVGYDVDHDEINAGDKNDEFRQIRIRVTDAPLKIMDLKIHFDNGSVQDVSIRNNIKQDGESRVIDLNGGLRRLDKIEFWYSTVGKDKGRAKVAVWGK